MDQLIRTTSNKGSIEYRLHGQRHRTDGPAIIQANGIQIWYQKGRFHRTDGPAVVWPNGYQEWHQHDLLHRTDGPAIIWPDGTEEYWLNGQQVDIMVHFLQRQ